MGGDQVKLPVTLNRIMDFSGFEVGRQLNKLHFNAEMLHIVLFKGVTEALPVYPQENMNLCTTISWQFIQKFSEHSTLERK